MARKQRANRIKKLYECTDLQSQKLWCLNKLKNGDIIDEVHLWIGGADPKKLIQSLIKDGVNLEQTEVPIVDCVGAVHYVPAWKLKEV